MPKKKKANSVSAKKSDSARKSDFTEKYVRLRTILDSIEMVSLRFVLSAPTPEEALKRADKLVDRMLPIAEKISRWIEHDQAPAEKQATATTVDAGFDQCPDGYYYCYGACVPYPCPPELGGESRS